jgi:hypothetical protein
MHGLCTDQTPRRRVIYTPFYAYYTRCVRIFRGVQSDPIQIETDNLKDGLD